MSWIGKGTKGGRVKSVKGIVIYLFWYLVEYHKHYHIYLI